MADFIIKSAAGTGNKTLIQGADASPAITIAETGTVTFAENVTMSGTANNLGTVTAGDINAVSDSVKLYSNVLSSTASSVNINGYFDDTKYAYYKFSALGVRTTGDGNNVKFRVMTGGSVDSSSIYWTTGGGDYSNSGTPMAMNRADNDGTDYAYADNTWSPPNGASNGTANYEFTFSEPQNATYHKSFDLRRWGTGHQTGDVYMLIEHICIAARTTTALTGVSLFPNASTFSLSLIHI